MTVDVTLLPEGYSKRRCRPRGPETADVMVLGEAPGEDEDLHASTFIGVSGKELDNMLKEAGFVVSQCYFTNVVKFKPPDTFENGKKVSNDISTAFHRNKTEAKRAGAIERHGKYPKTFVYQCLADLRDEIALVKPKVIIALGNVSLWALCGQWAITSYRGSVLPNVLLDQGPKVIPTFHPAYVLRVWGDRYKAILDLRRACYESAFPEIRDPGYQFIIRPSFEQAITTLNWLAKEKVKCLVSNDIETKAYWTSCTGFAWSATEAICIPFFGANGEPYWTLPEQEAAIVEAVCEVLDACEIVGQNYAYDAQYNFRRMLHFTRIKHDTLVLEHAMFPGEDKDLSTLSAKYCEHHRYWKEDSKVWDPKLTSEESHWIYNCTDCVKTWEICSKQLQVLTRLKLTEQYAFLMRIWPKLVWMMLKGVKVDLENRSSIMGELVTAITEREAFINHAVDGHNIISSPKVAKWFWYDALGMDPVKHKKTKKLTCDGDALLEFKTKHRVLSPLCDAVDETRSLRTFRKNFGEAPLDLDGRMRCYYNLAGTETFRLSSAESAFDTGTNLQNIPKGDRSKTMAMPNMRRLFVPDPGFAICEIDLAGADAQVVAWEANDAALKDAFRRGYKIHVVNAKDIFGGNAGPDGRREPYYTYAKVGVHLTNYRGKPGTLAKSLGITRHEADVFQRKWFGMHPGILKWHERVDASVAQTRCVYNKFGFRRMFFDRVENVLTNATAWGPQSTIGILINKALEVGFTMQIIIDFLLQVHDSLVFQIPLVGHEQTLRTLHQPLLISVPYDDPLTIQFGLSMSDKSWGDAEKVDWPK